MTRIHPTAVVDEGAELGAGVTIGAYAVVGPRVRIGARTRIHAHAVLDGWTVLGEGNDVHPNAVLGGPPQDLKYRGEETALRIGDRNMIREGVTINRGTSQGGGETVVGSDNVFMANSHIAHDCRVGDRVILANNVMLAGHVVVEDGAILNGGLGVHHFTTIGCYSYLGGLSRITRDVPPYMIVEGHPSRVRGVNVIGMKRAGFPESTVQAVKECYKRLFRSDRPFAVALAEIETEHGAIPEVMRLVAFLRASAGGRQGRQGERRGRGHA